MTSDGELLSEMGTDAVKWAEKFAELTHLLLDADDVLDAGALIGWFANAIEAGRMQGQHELASALSLIEGFKAAGVDVFGSSYNTARDALASDIYLVKLIAHLHGDSGRLMISHRPDRTASDSWMVAYEFGQEEPDNPENDMVGGAAYGMGETLTDALMRAVRDVGLFT